MKKVLLLLLVAVMAAAVPASATCSYEGATQFYSVVGTSGTQVAFNLPGQGGCYIKVLNLTGQVVTLFNNGSNVYDPILGIGLTGCGTPNFYRAILMAAPVEGSADNFASGQIGIYNTNIGAATCVGFFSGGTNVIESFQVQFVYTANP